MCDPVSAPIWSGPLRNGLSGRLSGLSGPLYKSAGHSEPRSRRLSGPERP